MAEKCLPSFSLTHMILWSVVHFTATKTRYRANKSVLYTKRKPVTQRCFAAKNAADFHACVWVPFWTSLPATHPKSNGRHFASHFSVQVWSCWTILNAGGGIECIFLKAVKFYMYASIRCRSVSLCIWLGFNTVGWFGHICIIHTLAS